MNIFKIVKKELDKIFKFPRQIFTTLLLPGLILFVIYAFLGIGMDSMIKGEEEVNSVIYVINSPESLESVYPVASTYKVDLKKADKNELASLKDLVLNGEAQAIIVYDENFDDLIQSDPLPKVKIYRDSSNTNAYTVMERASAIVGLQQGILYNELSIKPYLFEIVPEKLESDEKGIAMILAMILPMLLMSFIFASALGVGSDAIAGEKERGTLATLLMLPIKRSHIIIGKIISTSTITVLSAVSSFLGLLLSLPFAKSMFALEGDASINYGPIEIIGLVVILLLIALLASSILLVTSTIAKNIKEATTISMPIYIVALIAPMITMFSTGTSSSKYVYLIPIYNTILGLKEILSFNFDIINFLMILGSSIVYITILVFVLIKMFRSEKVLYAK